MRMSRDYAELVSPLISSDALESCPTSHLQQHLGDWFLRLAQAQ